MIVRLLPLLILSLLTGPSCVIDTIPMPEGDPRNQAPAEAAGADSTPTSVPPAPGGTPEDADLGLSLDPSAMFYSRSRIYLVGLAGATPGSGTLQIQSQEGNTVVTAELTTAENGSFAQKLEPLLGQTLLLTFTSPSGSAASLSLDISPGAVSPSRDTAQLRALNADSITLTRETSDRIQIAGPLGSLSEGLAVIASNPETQDAITGLVAEDGSFSMMLQASTGDPVVIFVVEPTTSQGGGAPIVLIAP